MKSISAFKGYRGFYEVYPECLIVSVYKDCGSYKQAFGFTINDTNEADIEYQFRLCVESYITKRPRIYRDLKMLCETSERIDKTIF